jgi:16S rRNA (cytosine967-C5)-methyltransferase
VTPAGRLAAAIEILEAIEAEPRRPADAIAHDYLRARRYIGSADRRAITAQAWGVVRQKLRLAWHLREAGAAVSPRLLAAAHALLVAREDPLPLFGADAHAPPPLSRGEAGRLERLAGRKLVMREMDEAARLNLPAWLVERFRSRFGERLAAEAAAMEGEAPLDLRANLLRTTREAAQAALAAEGITAAPTPFSPWGLRLPARTSITQSRAYREGLVEVQDEGSQLIALVTAAAPGERVADWCAGAGGKTLAMAAMMGNRGRITACDVHAARLEGAGKRLKRAGVDNAETHLFAPGDRWAKRRAGTFDLALVDAPCTGTGTWRRNPDARFRTTEADLTDLVLKQAVILGEAARVVRPGGRLVYATCSILPEENEEQVSRFLDAHPDFTTRPLATAWDAARPGTAPPGEGTHLALSPAAQGTDGFFAAVLERR